VREAAWYDRGPVEQLGGATRVFFTDTDEVRHSDGTVGISPFPLTEEILSIPGSLQVKRPSIHMPKWAARTWLRLLDVRVERVRDISEEDARAEGALGQSYIDAEAKEPLGILAFKVLWETLNAKRGFGWDVNPWVWALTFRRVEHG